MKSTFVRKTVKKIEIPKGTKASIHNGQLLISSGLRELDEILGGGLAIGSILLIEEEVQTSFYSSLMKYFISEGISNQHSSLLFSPHSNFIKRLPRNLTLEYQLEKAKSLKEKEEMNAKEREEEEMASSAQLNSNSNLTIAWQYEKYLNKDQSGLIHRSGSLKGSSSSSFCQSYDLSKPISDHSLLNNQVIHINPSSLFDSQLGVYQSIFHSINQSVNSFRTDGDTPPDLNVLRIGIQSLGSPFWGSFKEDEVLRFLHSLRGLLRCSLASCVITLPSHLFTSHFVKAVSLYSDTVLSMTSFEGSETKVSEVFNEYDGQIFVKKLPRLNSLVSHIPETLHYVYKMKRRKLHIEILTLGPEESRSSKEKTNQEKNLDSVTAKTNVTSILCAPGPQSKSVLDF